MAKIESPVIRPRSQNIASAVRNAVTAPEIVIAHGDPMPSIRAGNAIVYGPANCIEKNAPCFRWIHKIPTEKDFYPLNCHPDIVPRVFDDSDIACMSYGLSLYTNLEAARERYIYEYNKRSRIDQKEKFKKEKGENIAELDIKSEDGLHGEPNKVQHFTFYQYLECPFLDRINGISDIFVVDEIDEV